MALDLGCSTAYCARRGRNTGTHASKVNKFLPARSRVLALMGTFVGGTDADRQVGAVTPHRLQAARAGKARTAVDDDDALFCRAGTFLAVLAPSE